MSDYGTDKRGRFFNTCTKTGIKPHNWKYDRHSRALDDHRSGFFLLQSLGVQVVNERQQVGHVSWHLVLPTLVPQQTHVTRFWLALDR